MHRTQELHASRLIVPFNLMFYRVFKEILLGQPHLNSIFDQTSIHIQTIYFSKV